MKGTNVLLLDKVAEHLATKISDADRQALMELKARGHTMMVLSCGTADLSERILEKAGLKDCFDVIEGNRFQFSNGRITGMNLHMLIPEYKVNFMRKMGIAPPRTIAIGDGYSDIPLLNWSQIPIIIDRTGNKRKQFSTKDYQFASSIPNMMKIIKKGESEHPS
jgi:phosphoserine phosphatase